MISLPKAENDHDYRITWIVGRYADSIRSTWKVTEDTVLHVLNGGKNGILFRVDGRLMAMSSDIAEGIKLESA